MRIHWGPIIYGSWFPGAYDGTIYNFSLNTSVKKLAGYFVIPKTGTITKVGLNVGAITGNPPAYKVGLVTVDTNGDPTTSAYGGGSLDDFYVYSTGYKWITLTTPSSGSLGDVACVHIYPGATPPDSSNYIRVSYSDLYDGVSPTYAYYTPSYWTRNGSATHFAIQYDDGDIYGFPVTGAIDWSIDSGTTPDEVGSKFTVPVEMYCIGMLFPTNAYSDVGCIFDVYLYDADDTVVASKTGIDMSDYWTVYGQAPVYWENEVILEKDAIYRLTLKPTTTNNLLMFGYRFESAASRATKSLPESDRWTYTKRTDGGSWTDDDTAYCHLGLIISDIVSTSGSGGGPGATGYYGFIG